MQGSENNGGNYIEEMEAEVGKLGRRKFLKVVAVGGAAAVAGPTLLAACSSSKKDDAAAGEDAAAGGANNRAHPCYRCKIQ